MVNCPAEAPDHGLTLGSKNDRIMSNIMNYKNIFKQIAHAPLILEEESGEFGRGRNHPFLRFYACVNVEAAGRTKKETSQS